ncbi:MAG TPA: hypothetical protein VKG44_06900 [Candidatus Baltobacteraceae bacterium]|nr:hypothetical protein [Candidatus Baltobacteraceae bacterium]
MVAQPVLSPADELQRALALLTKNWILALPTAVASLILAIVLVFGAISLATATVVGHAAGGGLGTLAGIGTGALLVLAGLIVGIVVLIVAQAVVMRAAEDAWQGRPVDLAASFTAVSGRLPDLFTAIVLSFLIMLIPILLCFVLIGFPLIIVGAYFLMFVTPAVIIGGQGGAAAIRTSFQISTQNVGPSLIALLGILGAALIGNIAGAIASHIPLVNLVVPFAIGGLTSAYGALVAARFFDILSSRAPASVPAYVPPAPPSAGPPTTVS